MPVEPLEVMMADPVGEIVPDFVVIGVFEELDTFVDSFEGLILNFGDSS